jgi:threonine dehydratase
LRKVPAAGIAAASGGNHGAAVAYAAQRLGISATIFLPDITSPAKAERIGAYGAQLRIVGTQIADALVACDRFVAETGAMSVHPFDQVETMLGQGSIGMELEQDAGLDTLLVAVGGGGLIGSLAAWFAGQVRIVGVEPEQAPTLHTALAAGKPVDAPASGIAADALGPPRVGQLMFPIARAHVAEVLLVSEDEIRRAQAALWQTLRIVAEPGGAVAFAALLSGRYRPARGERVGLIISGANTTAVNFES